MIEKELKVVWVPEEEYYIGSPAYIQIQNKIDEIVFKNTNKREEKNENDN